MSMAERKCVIDQTATIATARLSNRWLMLGLLLCIALLNYADRFLLSGLAEPVKADFKLSDGFMGLLLGPAFALLYCSLAIPIARLADRMSRIAIICGGCALWSGFTILTGHATAPWMLALARVGVGVGEAAYQAPAAALIAAYFPIEQRGRAFALSGTAIYFGQILGLAGGPAIAAEHGWRTAFWAIGSAGIAAALAAYLLIREPPRLAASQKAAPAALWPLFRRFWAKRSFRYMALGMGLGTLSGVSFGMWGPALFERAYAIPTKAASTAFGLSFGVPGLIGMLLFGVVADRFANRGPHWLLGLSAFALFSASLLILLVTWTPSLGLARLLAIPSGLLGGGWSVGIFATLQYLLPERSRITGTALALLVIGLIGSVFGPYIAGELSDIVAGSPAFRLRAGLSVVIPIGFLGAWLIWQAGRTVEQDHTRLANEV
jgi:MFS family permease